MDDLQERLCTANMEEVYPADLVERLQQSFLRYSLSCFLIGYEEKMASYHDYFNNTGSAACTGKVKIMAKPNLVS